MLFKTLHFFLEHPYQEVYLRQLAKKTGLSPFAIKKYADFLIKEGLILEDKRANLRYFKANVNNVFFKHLKIAFNVNLLQKSGLILHLTENTSNVSSIVLFGSMAKGLDDEKSDADLLVIGKEKHMDLEKFEEIIRRDISLHVFGWSNWNKKAKTDKAFYLEVIANGICVYGEKPVI